MNANAIVAGTITGDHIASTTITGTHIDAGSINASHIVIGSGTDPITPTTIGAVAPGDVYSSRIDVAYFVNLNGSVATGETNSFPTGKRSDSTYSIATKGTRNFIGTNTVSWDASTGETAPSTTVADYAISQLEGDAGQDGSITLTYTSPAAKPNSVLTGDLLVDLNGNKLYRASSGGNNDSWVAITPTAATVGALPVTAPTGTTDISGGRISTDSLSAITSNIGDMRAGILQSADAAGNPDGLFVIDLNNKFISITTN
jgi:hypothetical protein